jgi:hypothetical protein
MLGYLEHMKKVDHMLRTLKKKILIETLIDKLDKFLLD